MLLLLLLLLRLLLLLLLLRLLLLLLRLLWKRRSHPAKWCCQSRHAPEGDRPAASRAALGSRAALHIDEEARQRDGREVAHGDLVGRGVLDDLRAEVGGADRAEVPLVGLVVALVGFAFVLVCDVDLVLSLDLCVVLLFGFLRVLGRAVLPGGAEVERFLRRALVGKEAFFLAMPVRRTFDRVLDLFFLDPLLIPSLDSLFW